MAAVVLVRVRVRVQLLVRVVLAVVMVVEAAIGTVPQGEVTTIIITAAKVMDVVMVRNGMEKTGRGYRKEGKHCFVCYHNITSVKGSCFQRRKHWREGTWRTCCMRKDDLELVCVYHFTSRICNDYI
ncbi:hypothetical protein F4811DRAFT_527704 [Daldinia bambusicola]|nr:hypothetical protein F4811DRAFT_527704 [Daldinia bambusicola]